MGWVVREHVEVLVAQGRAHPLTLSPLSLPNKTHRLDLDVDLLGLRGGGGGRGEGGAGGAEGRGREPGESG